MDLTTLFSDKNTKPSKKTETIRDALTDKRLQIGELLKFAEGAKEPHKATCLEALEYLTKTHPESATPAVLDFAADSLLSEAPRVKWESARVIGNIARVFPDKLDTAVKNLLINSEHEGTVVRWSTAYALGEIIKLKLKKYDDLIPATEAICKREEKNSIVKIYQKTIKKVLNHE